MGKPGFTHIRDAYMGDYRSPLVYAPPADAIRRVADLVSDAWDEAEREHREALEKAQQAPAERLATWEYADTAGDVGAFNRDQRIRREAYADALRGWLPKATSHERECAEMAAKRYPLKIRSARIVPDPHGEGVWTTEETHYAAQENYRYVKWIVTFADHAQYLMPNHTQERVELLLDLLKDPWTYVEDPNPEPAP